MTLSGKKNDHKKQVVGEVLIPILMDDPLGVVRIDTEDFVVFVGLNPYSNGWPSRGAIFTTQWTLNTYNQF